MTIRNKLIIVPSVRMSWDGDNIFMDIKLVEGIRLYANYWDGPVKCMIRLGDRSEIAFGQTYMKSDLGFEVVVISDDLCADKTGFTDAAIVLASGDNHLDLEAVNIGNCPVVFVIEYTLGTRLRILELELGRSLKALKSIIWTLMVESKRRRAFARSAGIQANGKPAFDAYRGLTSNPLLYFDSRVVEAEMATSFQIEHKIAQSSSTTPLRMAFSGRLDRMKGADHLIPLIKILANKGMNFTFDIFGSGDLAHNMKTAVQDGGLENEVIFHGPVSFDDVLLPHLKTSIDLFVCCHRQADPSCTYIETLACGVPIAGYDNAAFKGILELGNVGVSVPMDDMDALAREISALDSDRLRLATMTRLTAEVSQQNSFDGTFRRRIEHLERLSHKNSSTNLDGH